MATAAVSGTSDRAIFFMLAAESDFLAAARLALSCHSLESYKCSRACIETGHYGLLVHRKPALWDVWRNRHENDEDRRRVGTTFSVTKINRDHLAPPDPKLAKVILDLHERAIDYGAHFNVMAWATSFEVVDREEGLAEMTVLTTDESEIKIALHFTAMCGVAALRLFGVAFSDQFRNSGLAADLMKPSVECADLFDSQILGNENR